MRPLKRINPSLAISVAALVVACSGGAFAAGTVIVPDVVPDDWEPDEYDPPWKYVKRTDPGAVKVYVHVDA